MTRKKPSEGELAATEALSQCTCPKCGTRFQVAVRPISPKTVRAPDPRQLPLFDRADRRKRVSLSELLGEE